MDMMSGKAGEAALQEKLDKIRGDYLALVERVKTENVKASSDLEKKFLKDEEDFKKKQVNFLATLVALHFTPVSQWVSK